MLHFHVHNKVSLKAEHIDLSKPLFITLKVCINFRFSNLNLAQCWLRPPVFQHSVLRRKATLIFVSKICENLCDWETFLACTKALGPPPWLPPLTQGLVHTSAFSHISKFLQIFSYLKLNLMALPSGLSYKNRP